jgi:hypothetical protein
LYIGDTLLHLYMCLKYILIRFTYSIVIPHLTSSLVRTISKGFTVLFSHKNTKYIYHICLPWSCPLPSPLPLKLTPRQDLVFLPVDTNKTLYGYLETVARDSDLPDHSQTRNTWPPQKFPILASFAFPVWHQSCCKQLRTDFRSLDLCSFHVVTLLIELLSCLHHPGLLDWLSRMGGEFLLLELPGARFSHNSSNIQSMRRLFIYNLRFLFSIIWFLL